MSAVQNAAPAVQKAAPALVIDESAADRLSVLLDDEGLMRAGHHALSEADNVRFSPVDQPV
jgi:hypothetical protein